MKEKTYCVYKHTTPSGKIYIGITSRNPKSRWANGNGYKNSRHFFNAIIKYGWNNITHEILFNNLTEQKAKEIEITLIAKFNSNHASFGYNRTRGGDTSIPLYGKRNGMFGKTHSDETKKRMKELMIDRFSDKTNHPMYGKPRSQETKEKLRVSHKGKSAGSKNYFYGKHNSGEKHPRWGVKLTQETKNKISRARKGRFLGEKCPTSKRVICIETKEIFGSVMDIKRKYGYDNSVVSKCCKGKIRFAYGFHWQYLDKG